MRTQVRILAVLFSLFVLLVTAGSTFAQTYDVTWNGIYGSGSATFNTTNEGGGEYLITSITTGNQGGNPITLLAPNSYGANDNLLFLPGTPGVVDVPGFSFKAGSTSYNIYDNGGIYMECNSAVTACYAGDGFKLTTNLAVVLAKQPLPHDPTPEPPSVFLVLPAFVAFLVFAFRKGSQPGQVLGSTVG